jgi:hypothetical protein
MRNLAIRTTPKRGNIGHVFTTVRCYLLNALQIGSAHSWWPVAHSEHSRCPRIWTKCRDTRQLPPRHDPTTSDNASTRGSGLEQNTGRAMYANNFMRNGAAQQSALWSLFLRAASNALRMASGTERALPTPTLTRPLLSPTTTVTRNAKRRPPFTTLATRVISMMRSSYSCSKLCRL